MSSRCRSRSAKALRHTIAALGHSVAARGRSTAILCGAGLPPSLRLRRTAIALATAGQACVFAATLAGSTPPPLRVCADPNNMPFSNEKRQGFENRIAELVARDLRRPLTYFWSPQRRGFVRNTLAAGQCDVMISVPVQYERVQ